MLVRAGCAGFTALALSYGLGLWLLGPWLDRRGVEWAFYEMAGRQVPARMPLTLLYDDWDRNPYASPFGLIPHDLAVRLFYLGRAACWHAGDTSLLAHDHATGASLRARAHWVAVQSPTDIQDTRLLAVIGRDRDLPSLEQLGHVEVIARGPSLRRDRTYTLFRVTRGSAEVRSAGRVQTREIR